MPYPNLICCRLSDEDRDQLHQQAERFQKTPSEYIRYLIRIPVDAKEGDGTRCVVLDTDALGSMSRELTKWGYHYNQAVHAMNSINYYVAHGKATSDILDGKAESIECALIDVNDNAQRIVYEIAELQSKQLVQE